MESTSLLDQYRDASDDSLERVPQRSYKRGRRVQIWCWAGQIFLFLSSLVALILAWRLYQQSQRFCVEQLSSPSPALDAVTWEWQQFNGTVDVGGPFKGPPTPEVLARWDRFTKPLAISIDHAMLMANRGSEDMVRAPDGGYMAMLEVRHQVHCLQQLWMHTWPEFYTPEAGNASAMFRMHLDHCADILRQQLLCNGDVSVVPQNWVKHMSYPTPNFNVWRKCRNYDAISAWEEAHQILLPGGTLAKPSDAIELDELP